MPATYEVLEGIVQQQGRDDSGFKILERWCSYDQQYDGIHPKPGERVKLRVRNGRYIVQVVGEGFPLPPEPQPRRTGGFAQRSPEEERRIVRQAVLKAAIQWAESAEPRPKTEDVLKVAETFEQWVYPMTTEVERLRAELVQERAWREELQGFTIELTMKNEALETALDGAISHACHYKEALFELEQESRRPFATIEHIGFLARRALES